MLNAGESKKKIIFYFNPFVKDPFNRTVIDDEEKVTLSSRDNIVCEGDVLAKIIDEKDESFRSQANPRIEDLSVDYSKNPSQLAFYNAADKTFIAKGYGFARIIDGRSIDVVPLLNVTNNNMLAEIPIFRTSKDRLPSLAEIKQIVQMAKIVFAYDDSQIQSQLEAVSKDDKPIGSNITVAEGTDPVNGHEELIELRKSLELSVGAILEDGRVDYKERQSYFYVKKGELIAERIPRKEPEDGVDVFGNRTKAIIAGKSEYKLGKGLVSHEYNENLFVAEIDGVLEFIEPKKQGGIKIITIEDRLTIDKNISFETGNIHFDGVVEINGNVNAGFRVEATGDIYINGNVEDAEVITQNGNIYVKNGIIGKERCRLVAKEGIIQATFVQNSNLWAKREIVILESVINSEAFAREKVQVKGQIVGSTVIARQAIECGIAGSRAESKTYLTVGKDPEIDAKLDEINEKLNVLPNKLKELMSEITVYFGEDIFIRAKQIIPKLPKHRQAKCVMLLKEIKGLNEEIKDLKQRRDDLKAQMHFETPPYVRVETEIQGGVYISIKNLQPYKTIKKLLGGVFKEDPVNKVIKYE